jgi:cell division control protein 24
MAPTDLSLGNYTVQIFWKGDPNVENFIIKFKNEDTLRRWETDIEAHKEAEIARAQKNKSTSATQFTSLAGVEIENPHQEFDADDDDYTPLGMSRPPTYGSGTTEPPGYSEFTMSRNTSSTSLRSRSATGGSVGSAATLASMGRPAQRFPAPDLGALPPLNTQLVREASSPGDRIGNSYFSPVERDTTPPHSSSTRSSSQSTFAGYNRYAPLSHPRSNGEEPNRNTAPAMSRNMTGSTMSGNPYLVNGRGPNMRPSLPPSGAVQSAQQLGMTINRMRSASSPDIHQNGPQNRRYPNGQGMPNGENVPNVPPIPPHVAKQMAPVNRSQNNSPVNSLPIRNGTPVSAGQQQYGLPPGARPNMPNHLYTYDASYKGQMDPRQYASGPTQLSLPTVAGTLSPPLSTPSSDGEAFMPSQLKAKVRFDDNYISIVIASNIQFRSLIDRIDAKLARFTNHSIGSGSVRLKYQDEDEDFIWIDSDEAIHEALLDWRETHVEKIAAGQLAEILLYAQSVSGEPIAGNNQT